MRIIGWNPLSLTSAYRQIEVSNVLSKYGIIMMAGTQQRRDDCPVSTYRIGAYTAYSAGWRRGKFTNKSAGVTIWTGEGIADTNVKWIETPPDELAGRGLALRIRTQRYDVSPMVLYYPPRTGGRHEESRYKETTMRLTRWASKVISRVPARSTPVIYADINDELEQTEDGTVGDYPMGFSTADAGKHFRGLLADYDMTTANTHVDTGPTYWSTQGTTSRIDFIGIPQESLHRVRDCRVNTVKGRKLQLINTSRYADHYPIQVDLWLKYRYEERPKGGRDERTRWDQDKLMRGVKQYENKEELIVNVERRLQEVPWDF